MLVLVLWVGFVDNVFVLLLIFAVIGKIHVYLKLVPSINESESLMVVYMFILQGFRRSDHVR